MILRGLRQRVGARPILREHLHGSGRVGAEVVVCPREVDVEFGLVAASAKIGINAAQRRRCIHAPAGIVDGIGRYVAGQVTDLAAGLYGSARASV